MQPANTLSLPSDFPPKMHWECVEPCLLRFRSANLPAQSKAPPTSPLTLATFLENFEHWIRVCRMDSGLFRFSIDESAAGNWVWGMASGEMIGWERWIKALGLWAVCKFAKPQTSVTNGLLVERRPWMSISMMMPLPTNTISNVCSNGPLSWEALSPSDRSQITSYCNQTVLGSLTLKLWTTSLSRFFRRDRSQIGSNCKNITCMINQKLLQFEI